LEVGWRDSQSGSIRRLLLLPVESIVGSDSHE
jgi:hypothetical protein